MITIDGITYNVPITKVSLSADFLDKMAQRTEAGTLERELIGVFFNQQIQFGMGNEAGAFGDLYAKITEPTEFHTVTIDTPMGSMTFKMYCSNVKCDMLKKQASDTWWTGLTVNFTAQSPTRS